MKKLLLLTTAAVMMVAFSEPGFAASRDKNATTARPTVQYLDHAGRARTYGSPNDDYASASDYRYPREYSYPAQNLPYGDSSYGGPNGW